MKQRLQLAPPMDSQAAPAPSGTLSGTLDEALAALSVFNADGLEAMRDRVRALTPVCLTRELADGREELPELLRKHTLLGEILDATAANLKFAAAVLDAKRKMNRAAI